MYVYVRLKKNIWCDLIVAIKSNQISISSPKQQKQKFKYISVSQLRFILILLINVCNFNVFRNQYYRNIFSYFEIEMKLVVALFFIEIQIQRLEFRGDFRKSKTAGYKPNVLDTGDIKSKELNERWCVVI